MDPQLLRKNNLPIAVVEAVDPIVLDAKLVDCCDCHPCCEAEMGEVPESVGNYFEGQLSGGGGDRRITVTLGQFSIVRLERDSRLLVPVYDYCMPGKSARAAPERIPAACSETSHFPWESFSA